jgi:small ligand-binding sensory domain FIST
MLAQSMKPMRQAIAGLHVGGYDEGLIRAGIEEARAMLPGERADLAMVFLTPSLIPHAAEIVELVQVDARAKLLVGCSGSGVLANSKEVEDGPAMAFFLLEVPGAALNATRFADADVEEANGPAWWHAQTGIHTEETRGWLVFADPFSLDAESWLSQWNEAYPGIPSVGGLAGGSPESRRTVLFLNQDVFTEGAVAVSLSGALGLEPLVSQGCRPIGRPWTVTAAEQNLIHRIGNLPALNVLQETFEELSAADKARAGGNIFVGLAMNEYQEEHRRGDFLVRNLLAADPQSGVVAVGARVRVGQTLQFQFRDGDAAEEDLSGLLTGMRERLAGQRILGACLCSCAGRGSRLFGKPHHDARRVHESLATDLPLAGFFCNGEIGPVGGRNFLHGYTASAAILVSDARP